MKLVTNVSSFIYDMKGEDIVPMVAQAGFDAIDWCFSREFGENSPWMQENWKDYAQRLMDAAKKNNISFRQAHAYYPSATGADERDEEIFGYMVRTIEACGMMGIHDLVIHPFHHLPYNTNREALFEMSVNFYKALLPYAEKYKVILCTENMWQYDKGRKAIIESACARPEEFCAMIDAVDSPWLKGCLDIGHAPLVSQDPAYMIRCLGKDRLVSLHVHDVDLTSDTHTLPYLGKVNWTAIAEALAEIGYEGDFTYEISNWYSSFPAPLWGDVLRMTERVGRYLIGQIQAAKNR